MTADVTVEAVDLVRLSMPLRLPFRTSFGTQVERDVVLARVVADGAEGWGELVAGEAPLYSDETVESALVILRRHLIPRLLGATFTHPSQVAARFRSIRGNHMAKATLETACWDLWSLTNQQTLAEALGGQRDRVPTGVSVGIQDEPNALLELVERYLAAGYARIKIKIEPGWDVEIVKLVRDAFGDIALMADANSAYTLADADHLRALDGHGLMMIEQPLAHDDIIDHAELATRLATPICLDESLHSPDDVRRALKIGACSVVNAKVGRLSGHTATLEVHELCLREGVDLWCGGMLESGVGRLHNIALASLAGFTLPGDTSASDRYWEVDIIDPPVTLDPDGTVAVGKDIGLGTRLDRARLAALTVAEETHRHGA